MQEQPNVWGLLGASKERLGLNKDGGKVLHIGTSIGGLHLFGANLQRAMDHQRQT